MAYQAHIGDLFAGICCCHKDPTCIGMGGVIITGCSDNEKAVVGSIGIGFCGHPTIVVAGSGLKESCGSNVARVGDPVAGCIVGAIITGNTSQDVTS